MWRGRWHMPTQIKEDIWVLEQPLMPFWDQGKGNPWARQLTGSAGCSSFILELEWSMRQLSGTKSLVAALLCPQRGEAVALSEAELCRQQAPRRRGLMGPVPYPKKKSRLHFLAV